MAEAAMLMCLDYKNILARLFHKVTLPCEAFSVDPKIFAVALRPFDFMMIIRLLPFKPVQHANKLPLGNEIVFINNQHPEKEN